MMLAKSVVQNLLPTFCSRNKTAFGFVRLSYVFTIGSSREVQETNPGLRYRSEGWDEKTGQWGTLWTVRDRRTEKIDMCVKKEVVRVNTKSGETVTAIAYKTDSCSIQRNRTKWPSA